MLGAEGIEFLSPGLVFFVCLTSVSSERARGKSACTYIDLRTIEAILVHHPVKLENRKAALVALLYTSRHWISAPQRSSYFNRLWACGVSCLCTVPQIMTDTLKREGRPFHIPIQFFVPVKLLSFQSLQCCQGVRGGVGHKKMVANELRHMTPLYKSTSCHQWQRALEWAGGEKGNVGFPVSATAVSLPLQTDPDLITDRQLCRAP